VKILKSSLTLKPRGDRKENDSLIQPEEKRKRLRQKKIDRKPST
jgi:hypothetical protein